jgi:hypothetical protein
LGRIRFPVRTYQPNSPRSRPTKPHPLPLLATSRRRLGPTHQSTTHLNPHPFIPSPRIRTAPGGSCCGRACGGWDGLLARLARTPRERRARVHPNRTRPRRDLPHLPPLRAPLQPGLRASVPPRPPGRSKPGQLGAFASTFAAPGFKSKERPRPWGPSHQPLWGFRFLHPLSESRERRAPPPRRAGGAEHGPGARSWTRGRTTLWTSTSPTRPFSPGRQCLHRHPTVSTTRPPCSLPPPLVSFL